MQNKLLSVLIAAACVTCVARADNATSAPPTTPAVQPAAPTSAPTPTPVATDSPASAVSQSAPAPSQVIYSPRLPSAAELTNVASAQGLAVEQITQTSSQVTAVYKNAAGQLSTVAYQLLPTATAPATTVVTPSAPPTVVYQTAPRVVYYRSYDPYYYDPFWPRYYPPVSLSFGFGYSRGWGGHGHYHHWR